jgi:hypothetical protein
MKKIQPQINKEDKLLMQRLLSKGCLEHKFAQRLQNTNKPGYIILYINRYNTCGINSLLNDKTRKPGKEPVSQEVKSE